MKQVDFDRAHKKTFQGLILRSRRRFGKKLLHWFFHTHVDLTIEGLENIPEQGPLLILPNHLSNLDGPMILGLFPHDVEMVGPGDFRVELFKLVMMRLYGMTLIKRGYTDRSGMTAIMHHLKKKRNLLMFPSGGMWEKRTFENKTGALYFSQLTQTPMIPVGISGAYLMGRSAFFFGKPKLTLRFGKVIPPISNEGSKKERVEQLEKSSKSLADLIFGLLEPEEQAQYKRWMREEYSFEFSCIVKGKHPVQPEISIPNLPTLAQFAHKPNLFRPMWLHARKDMKPFRKNRYYSIKRTRRSAEAIMKNLTGDFDHYIPYRLGEEAHESTISELELFIDFCDRLEERGIRKIKCSTVAYDPQTGEKRYREISG